MNRVKRYIDAIFNDITLTREVKEQKESLEEQLTEKYEDLLDEGLNETEASNQIIKELGTIPDIRKALQLTTNRFIYRMMVIGTSIYLITILTFVILYLLNIIPVTIHTTNYFKNDYKPLWVSVLNSLLLLLMLVPFFIQVYITDRVKKNRITANLKMLTLVIGTFTFGLSGIFVIIAGVKMEYPIKM